MYEYDNNGRSKNIKSIECVDKLDMTHENVSIKIWSDPVLEEVKLSIDNNVLNGIIGFRKSINYLGNVSLNSLDSMNEFDIYQFNKNKNKIYNGKILNIKIKDRYYNHFLNTITIALLSGDNKMKGLKIKYIDKWGDEYLEEVNNAIEKNTIFVYKSKKEYAKIKSIVLIGDEQLSLQSIEIGDCKVWYHKSDNGSIVANNICIGDNSFIERKGFNPIPLSISCKTLSMEKSSSINSSNTMIICDNNFKQFYEKNQNIISGNVYF